MTDDRTKLRASLNNLLCEAASEGKQVLRSELEVLGVPSRQSGAIAADLVRIHRDAQSRTEATNAAAELADRWAGDISDRQEHLSQMVVDGSIIDEIPRF